MVANWTDNGGLRGCSTVIRQENVNGMGAAHHRGLMALGRSSDRTLGAMGSHWRRIYAEEQHNLAYIFKRWLCLLYGKWIVQGVRVRLLQSSRQGTETSRQMWGIF